VRPIPVYIRLLPGDRFEVAVKSVESKFIWSGNAGPLVSLLLNIGPGCQSLAKDAIFALFSNDKNSNFATKTARLPNTGPQTARWRKWDCGRHLLTPAYLCFIAPAFWAHWQQIHVGIQGSGVILALSVLTRSTSPG
jgi:hypothetical protein